MLAKFSSMALAALAMISSARSAALPKRQSNARQVFAHFMVGIVENYTIDDWKKDMQSAQEIGIDGFALNCAPPRVDSYTPKQLANAYQAAEEVGFKVFISFDFAYWSSGDTSEITSFLSNYSTHPAAATYADGAIVSTFVGDSFDWGTVKDALPGKKLTALPNFQDPAEATNTQWDFDGAFSWYAWPTDGGNSIVPGPMTTIWDDRFISDLDNAGKGIYMAPVSPWFFTHFNSKNWVFICEELITTRWQQMLDLDPELVEIVSWNDFGESHYIGPAEPNHSDDGSSAWADGFPHDGWRLISKPYIAAYKAGAKEPQVTDNQLVYWYRPTPKAVTCSSDTLAPPNGRDLLSDSVFVTTLLTEAGKLTVTSGNQAAVTVDVPAGIHTTNFTMGVGRQSFSVQAGSTNLSGDGGLEIKDSCETYNYNAFVGSL